MSPESVFFLLPFFLMAGVALQSAGLYFCLVLIPILCAWPLPRGAQRVVLSTAMLLAACYFLPVVIQSIVALTADPLRSCVVEPPRIKSCDLTPQAWIKSPVSAAFAGLGLGWGFVAFSKSRDSRLSGDNIQGAANNEAGNEKRLELFARGLIFASVVFFIYGVCQHVTGFNLLSAERILADEHRMPNGRFRIFSFYGHPLSLAGASLVWVAISLSAAHDSFSNKTRVFGLRLSNWLFVGAIQTANVYMSGGRTALLVAIVLWGMLAMGVLSSIAKNVLLPRIFPNRSQTPILLALTLLLAVCSVGAGVFLYSLGPDWLTSRGVGGGTMGQGPLGDRPLFWQTYLSMWRESPWFGQGYFAVEHGVRNQFYNKEGFAGLRDKFNAHNIFLEVLGISGIVGLFAFLGAMVLLYLNLKVLAGRSRERVWLLKGLLIAVITNLLHGMTQNTFFDSAVSACYLGIVGLFVVPPLKSKFFNA
ncbi:MAG: O-antigen ligase family protein [Silvanigrellaceae bacterium]